MALTIPTFSQTRAQTLSDVQSATGTSLLQGTDLYAVAMALAAQTNSLYSLISNVANTSLPWQASGETLEGWARFKGLVRKQPTPATSLITLQGVAGTTIPQGTILVNQLGQQYQTNTITTAGVQVGITSVLTGSAQNSIAALMTIQTPIFDVVGQAVTDTPVTGGVDQETDDALRIRVIEAFSSPLQGGNQSDYVTWSLLLASCTRAWCNPLGGGPGTVVVYQMCDNSGVGNGFPQGQGGCATGETRTTPATGDNLTLANWLWSRQPVGALVYVESPVALPVNFTIQGLTNDSTTVRAAISQALTAFFLTSVATPLAGKIPLSQINSAIQSAVGSGSYTLVSPSTAVSSPLGQLPVLGTVTYES